VIHKSGDRTAYNTDSVELLSKRKAFELECGYQYVIIQCRVCNSRHPKRYLKTSPTLSVILGLAPIDYDDII
jgi:hypothetical protein